MQVGIGLSTTQDYIKAVKEAVDKARAGIAGGKISLAIIFNTTEFRQPLALKAIVNLLGDVPILGASSPAVMSSQGTFKHGIIIVLFSLTEEAYFNIACVKNTSSDNALGAGEELGEKLLYGCKGVHRDLGIVFSNGLAEDNLDFISGLQEKLGRSFPLVGASNSGNNTDNQKTALYFNNEIINNAGCGILWGGKLSFGLGLRHGWQPLGKPHKITKSRGNIVNEIDAKEAANLYKEYFAKNIPRLRQELKRLSAFYPLGIHLPGEKEYLLRSLSEIKDDGSLVFAGDIPEGSIVRLMISSKESCLMSTRQAAEMAKKSMGNQEIKFALVFNSIARWQLLGRQADKEPDIIKEVLGQDTPLAGIYTYTQQAPLNSINQLGRAYTNNNSVVILTMAG